MIDKKLSVDQISALYKTMMGRRNFEFSFSRFTKYYCCFGGQQGKIKGRKNRDLQLLARG